VTLVLAGLTGAATTPDSGLTTAGYPHPTRLDAGFTADWAAVPDDAARKRVVVDQVASLTDQSALRWHADFL